MILGENGGSNNGKAPIFFVILLLFKSLRWSDPIAYLFAGAIDSVPHGQGYNVGEEAF